MCLRHICTAIFTARKRSLGQGNIFTNICVKNSVHRGGGSAPLHAGIPPPPPRQGSPPCAVHAERYGQQVGGMHPTGMQSCQILILIWTANQMATLYYVEHFTPHGVGFRFHPNHQQRKCDSNGIVIRIRICECK